MKPTLHGAAEDFRRHNGGLPIDLLDQHPFYDEFWREKTPDLDRIMLPMLVCASFSDHGLHTVGSFPAFQKAKSKHKWVCTHRSGKWDVYYSTEVQELRRDFMDCFLKDDTSSGFLERALVRLEVRSSRDTTHEIRDEYEWPLARTLYAKLHLRLEERRLDREHPTRSTSVQHQAQRGRTSFVHRFERDTELTGHMKLRLWVEAKATAGGTVPDDMAIFVAVAKCDAAHRIVPVFGSVGNLEDVVTRGFCRVSRRELDTADSTEWHPVLTGTSHQPLTPGEIVALDIELYPSSTFFGG